MQATCTKAEQNTVPVLRSTLGSKESGLAWTNSVLTTGCTQFNPAEKVRSFFNHCTMRSSTNFTHFRIPPCFSAFRRKHRTRHWCYTGRQNSRISGSGECPSTQIIRRTLLGTHTLSHSRKLKAWICSRNITSCSHLVRSPRSQTSFSKLTQMITGLYQ
jgi:hypothetical protein